MIVMKSQLSAVICLSLKPDVIIGPIVNIPAEIIEQELAQGHLLCLVSSS
jgi:ABC-type hemin transport system substrate-binding protein